MKQLTFKKADGRIRFGLPTSVKVIAAAAMIAATTASCVSDECRTTNTDVGSAADLGAQQDPNTFCDSD
jgi:hypothetical protein